MLIPHGTLVAVLDGRTLELHRNAGTDAEMKLEAIAAPTLPVGSPDSGHHHQSSSANPDRRLQEEDAFIAAAAKWLNHQAIQSAFETFVIVAAPRALGELRRHYHTALKGKIIAEIDRDLVGRPTSELSAALIR